MGRSLTISEWESVVRKNPPKNMTFIKEILEKIYGIVDHNIPAENDWSEWSD